MRAVVVIAMWGVSAIAVGCMPSFESRRPVEITRGPTTEAAPKVRLVEMLEVSGDAPTRLTVVLEGPDTLREIRFPELEVDHRVPLLGLRASTSYTATAWLESADGRLGAGAVEFVSGEPYPHTPNGELTTDSGFVPDGYTLYTAR